MSITTPTSYQFIEFTFAGLSGTELVGGYLLRWSLQFDITNHDSVRASAEFINARLDIALEVDGQIRNLGTAVPEQPVWITSQPRSTKHSMLFDLPLTSRALESLEQLRAGSPPKFMFKLTGEVIEGEQRHTRSDSISATVSHEMWIEALQQMKFRSALVYETPFAIDPDETVKAAHKAMERANHFLYRGDYDEVVAKCRIAIEAVETHLPGSPSSPKKTWTKDERLVGIISQLKSYTQLAHHLDEIGAQTQFNRKEAIFVLTSTIGAIACIAEDLDSK